MRSLKGTSLVLGQWEEGRDIVAELFRKAGLQVKDPDDHENDYSKWQVVEDASLKCPQDDERKHPESQSTSISRPRWS